MSAVLPLPRHKLSVDDYHRMGEVGILAPDHHVELIDGEIFDMAPIGSLHASIVSTLSMFFSRNVGEAGLVFTQNPIRLPPDSEPQPDLAILKPRADRYRGDLPQASDVLLLVEVSDTTANWDRQVKLPLYAHHGVPEVWVVDVQARQLEIYTSPRGQAYGGVRRLGRQDSAAPGLLVMPALQLAEIWPA